VDGRREMIRQRLREIIQTFRASGALSPETAKSVKELGLPPRFEEAMHRRLGQTRVFVETNGKYYLDEKRLAEVKAKLEERRRNQAPPST